MVYRDLLGDQETEERACALRLAGQESLCVEQEWGMRDGGDSAAAFCKTYLYGAVLAYARLPARTHLYATATMRQLWHALLYAALTGQHALYSLRGAPRGVVNPRVAVSSVAFFTTS